MTQGDDLPKTDESSIVSEFFEAWLEDAVPGAADPERSRSPADLDDPNEVADLIARTSECARLISQHWPAAPAASSTDADLNDTGLFGSAVTSTNLPSVGEWMARPVRLGRFVLQAEIGRGRFGIVYRAADPQLNREVAIKVAREEVVRSPELAERFLREAIAAGSLDHPGIVPVYESGESEGAMYYVMPYCEGEDLAHWLARQQTPVDQRLAAELIRQVATATAYGHQQGILHRDLKPANIILKLTSDGANHTCQARILDFGLSRSLDWDLNDTRSSMILGTPLYMSPEQAQQSVSEVGPSTDIFALGCILYELLTGEPPFIGTSFPEILERLRSCEPTAPRERRPEIDRPLEQICLKCLRLYPEDRYSSADELAGDLRRYLDGEPVSAHAATWLDRFRWWARRPQRVRDAGIAGIVINSAMIVSMAFTAMASIFDLADPLEVLDVPGVFQSQLLAIIFHVLLAGVGVCILNGRNWALWVQAAFSVVQVGMCLGVLLNLIPPFSIYENNPLATWLAHQLLLMLFSVQLVLTFIALNCQLTRSRQ